MSIRNLQFNGFNSTISKFFIELENNNNKEWFDKNRDFYINEIREPVKLLVENLAILFYSNGLPYIADTKKSIFRINRDIRFSKNKEPYKTNIGIFFPYTIGQTIDKKPESIGLYLHYERNGCFIAGGLHMPSPKNLRLIREKLLTDFDEFEKILGDRNFSKEFPGGLLGERLEKTPRGFPKEHPADEYMRMKEFTVYCDIDEREFFSSKIINILIEKAKAIEPFCRFLLESVNGN
jgi:uncharacterized protein (TIGR02453 family)